MSQPDFSFRPHIWWDPIDMEHILQEVELEHEQKARLLASSFETLATVHTAIAEQARNAAEQIGGGKAR